MSTHKIYQLAEFKLFWENEKKKNFIALLLIRY